MKIQKSLYRAWYVYSASHQVGKVNFWLPVSVEIFNIKALEGTSYRINTKSSWNSFLENYFSFLEITKRDFVDMCDFPRNDVCIFNYVIEKIVFNLNTQFTWERKEKYGARLGLHKDQPNKLKSEKALFKDVLRLFRIAIYYLNARCVVNTKTKCK